MTAAKGGGEGLLGEGSSFMKILETEESRRFQAEGAGTGVGSFGGLYMAL